MKTEKSCSNFLEFNTQIKYIKEQLIELLQNTDIEVLETIANDMKQVASENYAWGKYLSCMGGCFKSE